METSPSKRRKLSTTASIALNASTTDQQLNADAPQTTPPRASFLSPTKASLARFNPSLLPRTKAPSKNAEQSAHADSVKRSGHHIVQDRLASPTRLNAVALRSTTPISSPTRATARIRATTTSPREHVPVSSRELAAAPRRRSKTPGRASSPATELPYSATTFIPASPPIPEKESDGGRDIVSEQPEVEIQTNAGQRSQRRAGSRTQYRKSGHADDGEPELPLTPTELGLEPAPEPPKGLLYSSPSRRAGRKKGIGSKPSPLKPRDPPPGKPDPHGFVEPPVSSEAAAVVEFEDETQPKDPDFLAKKDILKQLNKQLQELRNDVTQLEKDLNLPGTSSQEEMNGLLSLITSPNPAHVQTPPVRKITISKRLASFLPFTKPPVPAPKETSAPTSPLPSHRPLQLENPLPYLRIFTPLTVSTVDTLVPSSGSDEPLQHHHDITLSSPYNLFQLELRLSINPIDESVASLSVTALSLWAKPELGSWICGQAAAGDISSIGWACGRYWEVARTRAQCWAHCHKRFGHLMSYKSDSANATETRPTVAHNAKRVDKSKLDNLPHPEQNSNDESDNDTDQAQKTSSPATLRAHLGKQSLLFSQAGVSLLVTWRIDFDWTGEVESHISACVSFPTAWRDADERASLEQVGEVFDRLLRQRGVLEAIRIVVALLFATAE
ncbi:hypothetical protein MMC13_005623 [Lambiella insularis]|nr:hypothetical protein [Lambiella insularis]